MSKANRKRARKLWARTGVRCHTCTRWIPTGSEFRVIEVDDPTTPGRAAVVATCPTCDPTTDTPSTQQGGGRIDDGEHKATYTLCPPGSQFVRDWGFHGGT